MSDSYKPQPNVGQNASGVGGLTDQVKSLGRDLSNKASELTESATRVAKGQAEQLGSAAKDLASDATGQVQTALNAQKTATADYLGTISQVIQRAAGEFDKDVPQAAQYIRQAAGQLDGVANAVRDRDVGELVSEVQDFARRQPTLFFGGAVVLGFAALRFFKSSAPAATAKRRHDQVGPGSYDQYTPDDQWRAR